MTVSRVNAIVAGVSAAVFSLGYGLPFELTVDALPPAAATCLAALLYGAPFFFALSAVAIFVSSVLLWTLRTWDCAFILVSSLAVALATGHATCEFAAFVLALGAW